MVRLLGMLLVVGGCGFIGLKQARALTLRPRHLRGLQSALKMLQTEIGYAATPLPEALARVGELAEAPAAGFFSRAAQALRQDSGGTAAGAWGQALEHLAESGALRIPDLAVLKALGQNLGRSDRADQEKNIELSRSQLAEQEAIAEGEQQRLAPMWRTLGFLLGIAVTLVFY